MLRDVAGRSAFRGWQGLLRFLPALQAVTRTAPTVEQRAVCNESNAPAVGISPSSTKKHSRPFLVSLNNPHGAQNAHIFLCDHPRRGPNISPRVNWLYGSLAIRPRPASSRKPGTHSHCCSKTLSPSKPPSSICGRESRDGGHSTHCRQPVPPSSSSTSRDVPQGVLSHGVRTGRHLFDVPGDLTA